MSSLNDNYIAQIKYGAESLLSEYIDEVIVLMKIISVHGYMRANNAYSAFRKAWG